MGNELFLQSKLHGNVIDIQSDDPVDRTSVGVLGPQTARTPSI